MLLVDIATACKFLHKNQAAILFTAYTKNYTSATGHDSFVRQLNVISTSYEETHVAALCKKIISTTDKSLIQFTLQILKRFFRPY
jgi:hypothetical protein